MLPRRLGLPCAALLAWSACSSIDDELFEPEPDAAPPAPATTLAYAGSYDATQHWDLSGLFLDEEGVGGLVADLVVSSLVQLAGVPESLADDARELVADAIRAPIRDFVNARIPDDLVPQSALLAQLAEVFADVEVGGVIGFAPAAAPNAFTGTEKLESLRLRLGDATYDVPIEALLASTGASELEGDFSGRVTGQTTLDIGDHALTLSMGTLVSLAGVELLDRDDLAALTEQALAAIACAELVALVMDGDDSYGIELGGGSYSVDTSELVAGCEAIKESMGDYVLGYFDRDAPVSVGGGVRMADNDDDEAVDELTGEASYGGEATLVAGFLVRPFAIVFDASHQ